ncbi:hypothetical protein [Streptomyces sp. NPDC097981]|uniref:hypothetical protein n=1 Tax=Streptomyces sp. NPDC097981 TaxID=3155428 RepID=UPI00331B63A2
MQPLGELLFPKGRDRGPEPLAQQSDRRTPLGRALALVGIGDEVAQVVPLASAVGFAHHLLEQVAPQVRVQQPLPVVDGQRLAGFDLQQQGVAVHHRVDGRQEPVDRGPVHLVEQRLHDPSGPGFHRIILTDGLPQRTDFCPRTKVGPRDPPGSGHLTA